MGFQHKVTMDIYQCRFRPDLRKYADGGTRVLGTGDNWLSARIR